MGVSPGERYGTPVIDLGYEAFEEEAVRLGEGCSDDVGEGFDYALGLGGEERMAKKRREAYGSEGTFLRESSSFLATSGAEVCLPLLALVLLLEPAACA